MKRLIRTSLVAGLLLTILVALPGCGFHLRGDYALPPSISPVYIEGARQDLHADLSELMRSAQIQVTSDQPEASSTLRVRRYRSDRRVLALDSNGKVAEYGLIEELRFDMVDAAGKEMVAEQAVRVLQSYINTEEQVLGKQQEENTLRRSMRRDLAAQTMRRLQTQLK